MTGPPEPSVPPDEVAALRIGEVATRTELSLRSLRHWDEVGLLRPSGRTVGGFRLYTEADVDKILLIRRMKPLGFTLEEMGVVLRRLEHLHRSPHDAGLRTASRQELTAILRDATDRRDALRRQLAMADEFIGLLGSRLTALDP